MLFTTEIYSILTGVNVYETHPWVHKRKVLFPGSWSVPGAAEMQERFIVSLQEPRKSHELICIKWTGGSKKNKKKTITSKTGKVKFCVCIIGPESVCCSTFFSAERYINIERFHYKWFWLRPSLRPRWLHFTWLRGQTQSTLVGEFSHSALAERRFLQHGCWLENESELLSLVEVKYSIVILSEVSGTWRIQH